MRYFPGINSIATGRIGDVKKGLPGPSKVFKRAAGHINEIKRAAVCWALLKRLKDNTIIAYDFLSNVLKVLL